MSTVASLLAEKHAHKIKQQQRHEAKLLEQERNEKKEKKEIALHAFLKHYQNVQFPTYKERSRLEALGSKYFKPYDEYYHEVLLRKIFVKSGGWKKFKEIERSRLEDSGRPLSATVAIDALNDDYEDIDEDEDEYEDESKGVGVGEHEEKGVDLDIQKVKKVEELDIHLDDREINNPQGAEYKFEAAEEKEEALGTLDVDIYIYMYKYIYVYMYTYRHVDRHVDRHNIQT